MSENGREQMIRRGAGALLSRTLSLKERDECLLVTDENHHSEIVEISSAGYELGVRVLTIVVPLRVQHELSPKTGLCLSLIHI